MEVSRAKSYCTASTAAIGKRLEHGLRRYGIKLQKRVMSLGSALGAGRRRNAMGLRKRLRGFLARAPRFRSLAAVGVKTQRLLRTGGIAALSFGRAVTGVAPDTP